MFAVVYLVMLIAGTAATLLGGLQAAAGAEVILYHVVMLVGGAQVLLLAVVAVLAVWQAMKMFGAAEPQEGSSATICRWEPGALGGGPFGRRHRHH